MPSNTESTLGKGNVNELESGKRYFLEIIQEPDQARMCGFGDLDRRVVDPIPVLELYTLTISGSKRRPSHQLQMIVHAALRKENHELIEPTVPPQPNLLVGNTTSSCLFFSEDIGSVKDDILNPDEPRCLF
ncbi:hypothetical protein HK096_010351, partial [Nowakowskiella sp. JEL0078]